MVFCTLLWGTKFRNELVKTCRRKERSENVSNSHSLINMSLTAVSSGRSDRVKPIKVKRDIIWSFLAKIWQSRLSFLISYGTHENTLMLAL